MPSCPLFVITSYSIHYTKLYEEQKLKYLPKLAKGRALGAFGLTEANAGTDVAGMQTTALLDGEEWVLNGSKIFITNAGPAEIYIVFAMTDKNKGVKGLSAFIVEGGSPGRNNFV